MTPIPILDDLVAFYDESTTLQGELWLLDVRWNGASLWFRASLTLFNCPDYYERMEILARSALKHLGNVKEIRPVVDRVVEAIGFLDGRKYLYPQMIFEGVCESNYDAQNQSQN